MTMGIDLQLNERQRRAVEWGEGPLLVLAGPGSGKTLVLTRRIARLVQDSPQARFGILGLTFTTQAADQMRTRVARLLGRESDRTRLKTFHSFARGMLRQHGSHLGLRPDFGVLSEADRVVELSWVMRRHGFDSGSVSDDRARRMLRTIDHLYREGHDWEDEDRQVPVRGPARKWVASLYTAYVRSLLRRNYLDYGGILACCVRLLRDQPRIAELYRNVFRFACVDEYQDTNKAQDLILRAIYPAPDSNLFVVADDDQAIFQWNGADPRRIWKLKQDYRMGLVQLPESYRCPPSVVDVANKLMARGMREMTVKEPMKASFGDERGGAMGVRRFKTHDEEVRWVASEIAKQPDNASECVVLARRRELAKSAANALADAGLKPYLGVRKDEFASQIVRFAHSALKLANAPNDANQLARICEAFANLAGGHVGVADAEAASAADGRSPLHGFVEAAAAGASQSARALLDHVQNHLLDALDHDVFVNAVFEWKPSVAGLTDRIVDADQEDEEKLVWKTIARQARRRTGGDLTLAQLLHEFETASKMLPPVDEQIQCLTIHGAKGKEFERVYLIGLVEDELPTYHATRLKGDSEEGRRAIEEERRNCFVAITRARSSVMLTYADSYFGRARQPSRFLKEMEMEVEQ